MKKLVTYSAGLIALYLAVNYASGSKAVIDSGASGVNGFVRSLQGRS